MFARRTSPTLWNAGRVRVNNTNLFFRRYKRATNMKIPPAGLPRTNPIVGHLYAPDGRVLRVVRAHVAEQLQSRYPRALLLKKTLFTAGFSTFVFGTAAVIDYETTTTNNNKNKEEDNCDALDWTNLESHIRVLVPIFGLNATVFAMWSKFSQSRFMSQWFISNTRSGLIAPMLLSMFSHDKRDHLGGNMLHLYFVAMPLVEVMGAPQFTALFISGGLVATFSTHLQHMVITRKPYTHLGASGAVSTIMGMTAAVAPDCHPFFSKGPTALQHLGLNIFASCLGALGLWGRRVNHTAHLGGALFGLAYGYYGQQLAWEEARPRFLPHYIELKHRVLGGVVVGESGSSANNIK